MRRAVLLILGLCFLTSITRPGFSEKPLRLFFEKNIDTAAEPAEEHTVRQGEWLFKILQDKGYSGTQIQQLVPTVKALNPHIPDLGRIKPGQVIRLPEGVAAAPAPAPKPAANTPKGSYDTRAYVVQTGDTLVEVLQEQGVPTSLIFSKYMNLFLELNPSIPNTNTLRVGQEIILPVVKGSAPPVAPPAESPAAAQPPQAEAPENDTEPVPDTPVTIVPVPVSPDTPLVATSNRTGARPPAESPVAPGGMSAAEGPAAQPAIPATQPAPSAPAPEARPEKMAPAPDAAAKSAGTNATSVAESRTPLTGLPFIRTVLKEMRFGFIPGDESMFPLPDSGWLHVKLFETPLVETPWGARVLFCPVPKSADWIESANRLGMKVCTVSPHWTLQEVLDKLAQAFPRNFRLWGARELVLTSGGISLTLQSPQMALVDMGGRKSVHMVWNRQAQADAPLPQGLHEVLDEAQVKVVELDAFNELSRLPARPRESIYVPVATHMDIIRAINPKDPEAYFGRNLPTDLTSLLQTLRGKELLQQGMAGATWTNSAGSRIGIQVPAWIVSGGSARVILLDRRFADPYLVSVLASEGYTCFVLPD